MHMLANNQWRGVWFGHEISLCIPCPVTVCCYISACLKADGIFQSRSLDLSGIFSDAIPSQLWNFLWDQVLKGRNEPFPESSSVHTTGFQTACRSKSYHLTVTSVSEENNLDGTLFQIKTRVCGCMCWCGVQSALYTVVVYTVSGASGWPPSRCSCWTHFLGSIDCND